LGLSSAAAASVAQTEVAVQVRKRDDCDVQVRKRVDGDDVQVRADWSMDVQVRSRGLAHVALPLAVPAKSCGTREETRHAHSLCDWTRSAVSGAGGDGGGSSNNGFGVAAPRGTECTLQWCRLSAAPRVFCC
jgi:hypothetical protein